VFSCFIPSSSGGWKKMEEICREMRTEKRRRKQVREGFRVLGSGCSNYVLCSGLLLIEKIGLQFIMIYIMQQDTHPTSIQSKPGSMQWPLQRPTLQSFFGICL
jgi:hypothetical protein